MTYRISTSRSELNLLPAFFFTVGSVVIIALCQVHPLVQIFVLPGMVVALTCLAGIVAGLVGRHWLVGMAISLVLSTIAANLYYVSVTIQSPLGSIHNVVAFQLMQLIPIVVLVSSGPALLLRFLRSWRLVVDRSPCGARTIEDLLLLMTFVALMVAAAINASSNEDFLSSVISLGAVGAFAVTVFLPLVRNSLSDSSMSGNRSRSDFVYFLIAGIPGVLLVALTEGTYALAYGLHYCAFAICLKTGLYCLDLTGLTFRNQQMDLDAKEYAVPDFSDSSKSAAHALGPLSDESSSDAAFSNGSSQSTTSNRDKSVVHGRWALGSIAVVVIALSILRMLFAKS